MKRLKHIEQFIYEKHLEEINVLNAIYDNQERSKFSQMMKDKQKQFIRRTQ